MEEGLPQTWSSAQIFSIGSSAERIGERLIRLLEQITVDPSVRMHRLEILSPQEHKKLIQKFNDTTSRIREVTLVEMFEEQAASTPNGVAIFSWTGRSRTRSLTLGRTSCLESDREGIGPEDIVAISMERSVEMIVAILGTLKAGAAYLPLDPDYPAERLAFMIEDARPKRVLTAGGECRSLPKPAPADNDRTTPTASRSSRLSDLHFRQHRYAQRRHHQPAEHRALHRSRWKQRSLAKAHGCRCSLPRCST